MRGPDMTGSDVKGRPGKPQIIRIFICSSGDMLPERDAAEAVIYNVAALCRGQAALEPYRWEKNISHFHTELGWQQNIPLPSEFDIFIGFVNARIGTTLTGDTYRQLLASTIRQREEQSVTEAELPTGTEFEIENAF